MSLVYVVTSWPGQCSRYSDCLRAGRSGDRIPVGARFSAPVQTGPEAHPASCTMGTGSFPGVSCGRGVTLTPHPLLVPRSKILSLRQCFSTSVRPRPGKFFFIRRGRGPNRFTRKYLSNFVKVHTLIYN